jgi:hypothetical protein
VNASMKFDVAVFSFPEKNTIFLKGQCHEILHLMFFHFFHL